MKAQVSIEYLIIVSVALMVLLPLILYARTTFSGYAENNKISLARSAVDKLGGGVNWVYSQGPPAKLTLQLCIPDLEEISLENRTILFKIETSAGISDIFYETVPELDGYLPTREACYPIQLVAYETYVDISVVE
jgi:hypothetical protein